MNQRRLGAIEGELVVAPPGAPATLTGPATPIAVEQFDGWTADQLYSWLEQVAGQARTLRLAVGLGLWVLRTKAKDEKSYSSMTDRLADAFDVSASTLWRWRKSAQVHYELDEPPASAVKARGAQARVELSQGAKTDAGLVAFRDHALSARTDAPASPEPRTNPAPPQATTQTPPRATAPAVAAGDETLVRAADALIAAPEERAANALGATRIRDLIAAARRFDKALQTAPALDGCAHPRAQWNRLSYGTFCGVPGCNARIS